MINEKKYTLMIGKRIKQLREYAGYTTKQLADYLGVTFRTYHRYECDTEYSTDFGYSLRIPAIYVIKLAELYNCGTDYILGLSDNKEISGGKR